MTDHRDPRGPTDGDRVRAHPPGCLLSVIIPTHCRPEFARDAIRSVERQRGIPDGGFEIIVVENAPRVTLEDEVARLAGETDVEVRYVHENRSGLHEARHRGALEARGEIVVYVDDDILAPSDWLAALAPAFDDPRVAIAGGPIRPRWEAPPPTWVADFPESYFSLLDAGEETRELHYPEGAYGCNLAVRKSTLFAVGGFNPDAMGWDRSLFWLRGDGETGLHRRIDEAGFRAMYLPDAGLEHRMPASRLTAAAMRRRGLMVGLSHSYSEIRATPRDSKFGLRLLARGLRATGSALRCAAAMVVHPGRRVFLGSEVWRHLGYSRQHIQAAVHTTSREYLLRDGYLPGDRS